MKAMISGLAILVLVLSLATCSAGGLMNGTLATVEPAASTPAAASSSSTVATTESLLAALHAPAADDATIAESENAVPIVLSGAVYLFADPAEDEPNAALFTKADLTIAGSGALQVIGNYNDGIASKDGLILRAAANA